MRALWVLVSSLLLVSATAQLPSQDILALLEFKKGIKHDPTGFVVSSWNEESIDFDGCPSSWNGIVCNSGSVAGVVLDNLGLSADVDLKVFSNLTKLAKLSLSNNSITGKFPDNIAEFQSLEFLDISNNLFDSSLPQGIGKLTGLQNLSLAGNNFSGNIDPIVGLQSIRSLDLSRNSFSGPLPTALTKLTNLVYLDLSLNGFTKSIPNGFELISDLKVLDLHGNMLDGTLNVEFFMLSGATHIDFSSNMLTSSDTEHGKFLPRLSDTIKYLNLSHNLLTGSLVNGGELSLFENLKTLDLSYNQLSGELPGFSFVYELQILKLSNNRFSGDIPNNLLKGDASVITELDLSANNLSGPISMITSTTLRVLNLSSNQLTGDLPLLTGSCVVLDLSNNKFEGNLTRMIKWGNIIEFIDLSQNLLTGPIPEVTPQFLRLNFLNLSHNTLSSSLPSAITNYPKLRVLDLSSNQFDGPLLADLLTMSTLEELYLENNLLSGAVKFLIPSPGQANLEVLDLSDNQLSGYFPDQFISLTSLTMLNIAGNNFSGSLPTSLSDLSLLTSLDISQNHFTGPLPRNLSGAIQNFNASSNDLSGTVPENLRKFPRSAFYPGNSRLILPNSPGSNNNPDDKSRRKKMNTIVKVIIIVSCVIALVIIILLAIFFHYICIRRKNPPELATTTKDVHRRSSLSSSSIGGTGVGSNLVVSAEDLVTSRKGLSSEIISPDEKLSAGTGFSPAKNSNFSWSPESGDSFTAENLARLDVRSPDRLAGEIHFLDDSISLTPEELSRAPAEVLGRSSHGTSYRATLESGMFLTVKWLREGVAKQRKEFAKEAKKFANIRHPNVVGLRGYYWGPTQHEKLILSDYISPGNLAVFLYDRPGRKGPLTWAQRLKIAVDIARGLNYLHFDRAVPHGNLKATNVLLDGADLNARVADYCLHRLMTHAGTIEQILDAGVLGYRAPELAASKKPQPSFKSDVYAFGVILLELLTGRCAGDVISGEEGGVDLTDWVRLRVAEGRGSDCFDTILLPEMSNAAATEKGMKEVLGIALRCIRTVSERPGIKTIYEELSSI